MQTLVGGFSDPSYRTLFNVVIPLDSINPKHRSSLEAQFHLAVGSLV